MDIMRVESSLVCTHRHRGLHHVSLRVLRDASGTINVAVDPVGARPGNWVFTTIGTAARHATGDYSVLTDLTICGIIDHFTEHMLPPAAIDQRQAGTT